MMEFISPARMRTHDHIPRKIYHAIGASVIPTVYLFETFDRETIALWVTIATAVWLLFDFARINIRSTNELFSKLFGFLMKEKESHQLTGVTYVLIGSTVALLLFPPMVAVASIYFMSIGDPVASMVGKGFGRLRLRGGRTVEGSGGMFLACILITFFLDLSYGAIFGAITAVFAELFSDTIDDNLMVPLASGTVMMIMGVS